MAAGAKKCQVNVTVEGETYPAGTMLPAGVVKLIDNPKVWVKPEAVDEVQDTAPDGDAPSDDE